MTNPVNQHRSNASSLFDSLLLEAIRIGGDLDQCLNSFNFSGEQTTEAKEIYDGIKEDLADLQLELPSPNQNNEDRRLEERLVARLRHISYPRDAVLHYALMCHGDVDDPNYRVEKAAWEKYSQHVREYDQILDDFIPPNFREEANNKGTKNSYIAGFSNTAHNDWNFYKHRREERASSPQGPSTGLAEINAFLGGLSGTTYLCGPSAVGKTSLALFMAVAALRAHSGLVVNFFSLDLPKDVIYDRLICAESGVDYQTYLSGNYSEKVRDTLEEAEDRLLDILPRLRVIERCALPGYSFGRDWLLRGWMNCSSESRVLSVIDDYDHMGTPSKIKTDLDADLYRNRLIETFQSQTKNILDRKGSPLLVITKNRKGVSIPSPKTAAPHARADLEFGGEAILTLLPTEGVNNAKGKKTPLLLRIQNRSNGGFITGHGLMFDFGCFRFWDAGRCGSLPEMQTDISAPEGEDNAPSVAGTVRSR